MKLITILHFISIALISGAVLNPFDKFHEPGFMPNILIEYLTFIDQINFSLTCRKFYSYLEGDYDDFITIATLGQVQKYSTAPVELKEDIVRLYKYFKIEMELREEKESFTIDHLFLIIEDIFTSRLRHSFYFKNILLSRLIENTNKISYMKKSFNSRPPNDKLYSKIPHFPELSFILFRSNVDMERRQIIIENAVNAPYLFVKLFKYLANDVYHVSREDIYECLLNDYPSLPRTNNFDNHQVLSLKIYSYLQFRNIMRLFVSAHLLPIATHFLFFKLNPYTFIIGFPLLFNSYFTKRYRKRFEAFCDPKADEVRIFDRMCDTLKDCICTISGIFYKLIEN